VAIQPGYAIDALGREIVLTEARVEPVPPVANDGNGRSAFYDLTVSYPSDEELEESETREGICLPRGVVRLREAPVFCWVRLGPPPDRLPVNATLRDQVQNGLRIRLARAEVLNCQLEQPLSTAQRRNARPPAQPYVTCGHTPSQGWSEPAPSVFGVQIERTVDTSKAGFRITPCYLAQVAGDRHFRFSLGQTQIDLVLDGFVNVLAPTATSFRLSVLLPATFFERNQSVLSELLKQLHDKLENENKWYVEWAGIEG